MTRNGTAIAIVALVALVGGPSSMAQDTHEKHERAIRHSDVVFMYDNPKLYEAYGCTVLGWAGRPGADHIAAAHAAGVRRFSCSVGFLTEGRRVIDFSKDFLDAACRDFSGQPFVVPWLWDHKHKNTPFYWWCTNSPLYRRYLEGRLAEVMKDQPDGLHIDDYRGTSGCVTWLSGCFCRHCMAGFRQYLAAHGDKDELARLGVGDLEKFDYREFLLSRGLTPANYKSRWSRAPLAQEFYDFQVFSNDEFVGEYRKLAERLRGAKVSLSVNSGLDSPHGLMIAPRIDHFCCEVGHQADRRRPPEHPVYIYKLADGLGRPVAATAGGGDWSFVAAHNLPGLVRTWIALSYAMGHNLMAPHRQWCYTREKGTHWYDGPTDQYAPVYRFVRSQAALLDGYEAVAPVAVVYGNAANRKSRGRIEPVCTALAAANVPFAVVVAGDNWLDYRLSREQLARFRAVVVPKDFQEIGDQQKLLDAVAAEGRLVTWPDKATLARLVPAPVAVEGAGDVWAVPRAAPDSPGKPAVVHLLNRNYDPAKDALAPAKGFTVRLRRDLFAGRKFTKATLHTPSAQPVALKLTSDADHTTVAVGELDFWAIVELGN